MIQCPNCHHQEVTGALFCSECGTQLVQGSPHATQMFRKEKVEDFGMIPAPKVPAMEEPAVTKKDSTPVSPTTPITFHLIDTGQTIPVAGRTEFTIGRATDGQPILPDIDLAPYDAFSQGVSRLHAALKIIDNKIVVVDLGSSNGTRVNGQKIVPNVDFPLNHGDIIALGKLKIQILIQT